MYACMQVCRTYRHVHIGNAYRKPECAQGILTAQVKAGFLIEYVGDKTHQPHADDSDITLNICIGEPGFRGDMLVATNPPAVRKVYSRLSAFERSGQHQHGPFVDTKMMPTEELLHEVSLGEKITFDAWGTYLHVRRMSNASNCQSLTHFQEEGTPSLSRNPNPSK